MAKEMDPANIELLKPLTEMEYIPAVQNVNTQMEKYNIQSFSFAELSALGTGFAPIFAGVQKLILQEGTSGFYYVDTMGKEMFTKNGENAFIGSLKNINGRIGGGQARITPLGIDPTGISNICLAAAVLMIERKLKVIEQGQKDITEFLELKETTKLQGKLNVLGEVINTYKFNWDNESFKSAKRVLVQDIRKEAEESIILYRELIAKKIKKKVIFHSNQELKDTMEKLKLQFKNYQLALYLFAYSSFIEVMLLENFNSDYLNSVTERIEEYEYNYRSLYTESYDRMENYNKSAIETQLVKGISKLSVGIGEVVSKIPKLSDTQLDENLVEAGDKLKANRTERIDKRMKNLIDVNDNVVIPFVNNIKMIDNIYNKVEGIGFDKDNVYFKLKEA